MQSIHQLNHPGRELEIKYSNRYDRNNYYFFTDSNKMGVRLWNRTVINGKRNSHKRKFIEHPGKYLENVDGVVKSGLLRFWGEYEGHSVFEITDRKADVEPWNNPSAIHKPFFCKEGMNDYNTDPFIFGENFYYAICKKHRLKNLQIGDIILFGSEFGKAQNVHFYLDTLFVVDHVVKSDQLNFFSEIYIESTINRLVEELHLTEPLEIHIGRKYSDSNKRLFSFFPAKPASDGIFGRPIIDTVALGLQKPGARTGTKSRMLTPDENIETIWLEIVQQVLNQGFVLGIHAENLPIYEKLPQCTSDVNLFNM